MPNFVSDSESRRSPAERRLYQFLFPEVFAPENNILPNIWFDRSGMQQSPANQPEVVRGVENQQVAQQVQASAPQQPPAEVIIRPNMKLTDAQEHEIRSHFDELWSFIEFLAGLNQLLEER